MLNLIQIFQQCMRFISWNLIFYKPNQHCAYILLLFTFCLFLFYLSIFIVYSLCIVLCSILRSDYHVFITDRRHNGSTASSIAYIFFHSSLSIIIPDLLQIDSISYKLIIIIKIIIKLKKCVILYKYYIGKMITKQNMPALYSLQLLREHWEINGFLPVMRTGNREGTNASP